MCLNAFFLIKEHNEKIVKENYDITQEKQTQNLRIIELENKLISMNKTHLSELNHDNYIGYF